MSAIFLFEKGSFKKTQIFIFLKGCYFVMGNPIDMNIDVFWETSVGFLKVWFCNFSRNTAKAMSTWMSKVGQNSMFFLLNVLLESTIHFTQLSLVLAKKNVGIFT